jgi:hypothetical protein
MQIERMTKPKRRDKQPTAIVIRFPDREQRLRRRALTGDAVAAIEWLGQYSEPPERRALHRRVWCEMKAEGLIP